MRSRTHKLKAIALCLVASSASTALAVATPGAASAQQPLPTIKGPHPGAPLGGSSIVQPGSEFFNAPQDLNKYKPGDIIDQRTLKYHIASLPTPIDVVQIKYRSTDVNNKPSYNITSVAKPLGRSKGRLISLHSVYDSLDVAHSPSRAVAGDLSLGLSNPTGEATLVAHMITEGYTVAFPDIEGQNADLFVGPTYGRLTLDGIRAALKSRMTGLKPTTKVGLIGYSGGAIASTWAAQLAPSYAPDINKQLVGAAAGGIPVNLMNTAQYADHGLFWGPIGAMALVGLARGHNIDLDKYLSPYGKRLLNEIKFASVTEVTGSYSGVTLASLLKPEYKDLHSIPELVEAGNKDNLLLAPNPTVPFFIGEANGGILDGTPTGPRGIGTGDGVMVTGDVHALAHKYCSAGLPVTYREYQALGHTVGFVPWYAEGWGWLKARFDGKPARSNCHSIPKGNSTEPAHQLPPGKPGRQTPPQGLAGIRDALKNNRPLSSS